jgi:type IV secretion system protein VirD4
MGLELWVGSPENFDLKSFLIAQSLNQIEKAFGQNNSILDNCHVRVSFATNDERTAGSKTGSLRDALPARVSGLRCR